MLTYEADPKAKIIKVRLFRKIVGHIVAHEGGYRYRPKGAVSSMCGPVFSTVQAVKRDIESD